MANPDDVLTLAAIIRGVGGVRRLGAATLAESILNHPASRWGRCPHLAQGDSGSSYCRLAEQGAPAVAPVPIAERPWERPGWCDAEGQLLFFEGEPCDTTYEDRNGKYQDQPERVVPARM